jgi:hypothetical protein
MLPLALGAGLLLPIAGAVYDRIGPRTLVVGGFALLIYNTWQLANLSETTSLAFIVMLTAIRGIALGLTVQTPFTAALADVTHAALPRATSLVSSSRYLVQAYGIAVLATLLAAATPLAGLRRAYLLTFALAIGGLALGLLLPGWPGRWPPGGREVERVEA